MPGPGAARSTAAAKGRYRRKPDSEKNRITPSARWGMKPVRGPSAGWSRRDCRRASSGRRGQRQRRERLRSRAGGSRTTAARQAAAACGHHPARVLLPCPPWRCAIATTPLVRRVIQLVASAPGKRPVAARDSLPCRQPRCSDERIGTTLAERDSGRRRPLVTGAHRSGTTWVGRMIDLCRRSATSTSRSIPIISLDLRLQVSALVPVRQPPQRAPLQTSPQRHAGLPVPSRRPVGPHPPTRRRRASPAGWPRVHPARLRRARPLMKDPIAAFSSSWLASTFDMATIVLVRHPAGFASSLKRLGWSHPFNDFLAQPALMEERLQAFEGEIARMAKVEHDIVDQASLLWRMIYSVLLEYRRAHPDWIVVRHEDLASTRLAASPASTGDSGSATPRTSGVGCAGTPAAPPSWRPTPGPMPFVEPASRPSRGGGSACRPRSSRGCGRRWSPWRPGSTLSRSGEAERAASPSAPHRRPRSGRRWRSSRSGRPGRASRRPAWPARRRPTAAAPVPARTP